MKPQPPMPLGGVASEPELREAIDIIDAAARRYDPIKGQQWLELFSGTLEPNDFNRMLVRAFDVSIPQGSLPAVAKLFGNGHPDTVDGYAFIQYFLHRGAELRSDAARAGAQGAL